jgi:hypothetical protein
VARPASTLDLPLHAYLEQPVEVPELIKEGLTAATEDRSGLFGMELFGRNGAASARASAANLDLWGLISRNPILFPTKTF